MQFVELNENKQPKTKLDPKYYKDTYNQFANAGVILGNDVIVLDFDGDNDNEKAIIQFIESYFPTLCVETTRGKHFYYKIPKQYQNIFKRQVDATSVLGFQCDYLTGEKAFATIKLNGITRKMNKDFSFDDLPELPKEFYPLPKAKGKKLSGMKKGSGRNEGLFYHLLCVRETYPEIDINALSGKINNNVFTERLKESELKSIIESASKHEIKKDFNSIKYSSAKELQEKDLPPIVFFLDSLLPQGLNLISSLPKIGKSFMALDLCISISKGLPFLGFNTTKASCLYLALEDSENRLQDRLNKVLNGDTAPENFLYTTRCDDIDNGLIFALQEIIKKEPNIKVIVIDTLQKIRGSYKGNNNYANDYQEMGKLKVFADDNGLCIILIHHLKKGREDDVFGKVSGTNGIIGSADTIIVLDKKDRADQNTTLHLTGRDVEFNEYVITFNQNTYKWEMVASYDDVKKEEEKELYQNDPLVDTIKNLVSANNNKWSGSLKELKKEYEQMHPYLFDHKVTKKTLDDIIPLLKKYDNIEHYAPPFPKNGKRERLFCINKTVETVESVEKVE